MRADPANHSGLVVAGRSVPLGPARPLWRVDVTTQPWRVLCHGCAMRRPFPQNRHGAMRLRGCPSKSWGLVCRCGRPHPAHEGENDG